MPERVGYRARRAALVQNAAKSPLYFAVVWVSAQADGTDWRNRDELLRSGWLRLSSTKRPRISAVVRASWWSGRRRRVAADVVQALYAVTREALTNDGAASRVLGPLVVGLMYGRPRVSLTGPEG